MIDDKIISTIERIEQRLEEIETIVKLLDEAIENYLQWMAQNRYQFIHILTAVGLVVYFGVLAGCASNHNVVFRYRQRFVDDVSSIWDKNRTLGRTGRDGISEGLDVGFIVVRDGAKVQYVHTDVPNWDGRRRRARWTGRVGRLRWCGGLRWCGW